MTFCDIFVVVVVGVVGGGGAAAGNVSVLFCRIVYKTHTLTSSHLRPTVSPCSPVAGAIPQGPRQAFGVGGRPRAPLVFDAPANTIAQQDGRRWVRLQETIQLRRQKK